MVCKPVQWCAEWAVLRSSGQTTQSFVRTGATERALDRTDHSDVVSAIVRNKCNQALKHQMEAQDWVSQWRFGKSLVSCLSVVNWSSIVATTAKRWQIPPIYSSIMLFNIHD